MPARVLAHVYGLETGGAERQLCHLVRGLHERGFEPHVLTLSGGGRFWEELAAWGRCPLVSLERSGRWDFSIPSKLARYAREQRIDLIQGWMPPCNSFAGIAGALARLPAVMAVRASRMPAQHAGRKAWVRIDGWVGRFAARRIVCNSEAGRRLHRDLGYPEDKLMVIPNGVAPPADRAFGEPLSRGIPRRIGMIARLDPVKQHGAMFEALRRLQDDGHDVELHLFGAGPEDYAAELKHFARELGVEDRIHWHGSSRHVWEALDGLDIVVQPSSGEGMSNAMMEALACGRIVVATDVGDSRTLLEARSGATGFVVPPDAPEALARTIEQILASPAEALERAARAVTHMRGTYGVERMVERYAGVYEEILGN